MSSPLTTVHLIRHGSVVGAETQRFIGHLDVALSPLGETQCGAVASRLSGARLVASAPVAIVFTTQSPGAARLRTFDRTGQATDARRILYRRAGIAAKPAEVGAPRAAPRPDQGTGAPIA